MNIFQRRFVVVEIVLIKLVVIFLGQFALILLPERNHGIECFLFLIRFGGLALFSLLFREFLIFRHFHSDGVTDIIGILFDEASYFVFFEEFAVFFVVGILFNMENDFRSSFGFFARRDIVTFRTRTRPDVSLVLAERFGENFNLVGYHKRRIKPYAELTDYVYVVLFLGVRVCGFEIERAALGDRSEVFFEFFRRHTDAVIGNRERAGVLIRPDFNIKILAGKPRNPFFQTFII